MIALAGERAGDWIDFDDNQGGGPLSTLEHATGLTGRALIEYAAELAGSAPVNGASHPIAETLSKEQRAENIAREIELILARTVPLGGTAGETYLAGRGLQVPDTPDLLFHPDLTYWDTRTGYPALIAIVRDAAGEQIAIHRTYLAPDGSGKADVPKPRMMLGSVAGGAVRLGDVGEHGVVGLAEGIETALSVMQACPALPVWAALSSGNLEQVVLPPEITRVVLLADHDGEGVGLKVAERAAASVPCRGTARLDRPSTGRRRRLQRSVAEEGRRRGPPGSRGRGRMAARATATSTAASDGRTRARHAPGARLSRPDVAASPDACRRWRPRPAHQSLLEPAVRLERTALALPLRRWAVLDRAGQRRPAGAAAHDRGSPAACARPAGQLAQARPERRPGAGLSTPGAPQERARHARSGAAGAGRHRHRAGVRQRRHADHGAGLSSGHPAAL